MTTSQTDKMVYTLDKLSEKTGRSVDELKKIIVSRGIPLGHHYSSTPPYEYDYQYVHNSEGFKLIMELNDVASATTTHELFTALAGPATNV